MLSLEQTADPPQVSGTAALYPGVFVRRGDPGIDPPCLEPRATGYDHEGFTTSYITSFLSDCDEDIRFYNLQIYYSPHRLQ